MAAEVVETAKESTAMLNQDVGGVNGQLKGRRGRERVECASDRFSFRC
jgi:hypothetical protein